MLRIDHSRIRIDLSVVVRRFGSSLEESVLGVEELLREKEEKLPGEKKKERRRKGRVNNERGTRRIEGPGRETAHFDSPPASSPSSPWNLTTSSFFNMAGVLAMTSLYPD